MFDINLFPQLAKIESKNFWYQSRNELLLWSFAKYFPRAKSFFEIGCGTGFVLSGFRQTFPHLDLYASDMYSEALGFVSERVPKAELHQMDARNIHFKEKFDAIGAFDVLEHIEEDELVLGQMFQALKPGGGLLLTVPQHPFLWSEYDTLDHHVRRYHASDLKSKVCRAGFDILRTSSFVSALLPAMALSRRGYRKKGSQKTVAEAFHAGEFTNRVLKIIMDAEQRLIRWGCSFPFGGSLLLVASKRPGA